VASGYFGGIACNAIPFLSAQHHQLPLPDLTFRAVLKLPNIRYRPKQENLFSVDQYRSWVAQDQFGRHFPTWKRQGGKLKCDKYKGAWIDYHGDDVLTLVVARILKNWDLPNPNLLPFLVRFVRIRFE
jgi:hypothetical protein